MSRAAPGCSYSAETSRPTCKHRAAGVGATCLLSASPSRGRLSCRVSVLLEHRTAGVSSITSTAPLGALLGSTLIVCWSFAGPRRAGLDAGPSRQHKRGTGPMLALIWDRVGAFVSLEKLGSRREPAGNSNGPLTPLPDCKWRWISRTGFRLLLLNRSTQYCFSSAHPCTDIV